MASLSAEEENYVRMSLLLTGISPRAARTCFDYEFAPACLEASLKKEYNKLFTLKKERRINQSQWNLLFPRFPDVPDSKKFDVTLIIALLRNLIPMSPPSCGFDNLPASMETTPAADLARIKYYRNKLAHLDNGKIDITFFNTAWNDLTGAIGRLGGQQMRQECDHMKTKPLDQNNEEIILDIKHSRKEIQELKESFESMNLSLTEMIKSHESLQENHAVVTKEIEEIKISQMETVPWNIRVRINNTLKAWKDNDEEMFINTRAAQHVLKCIRENSCVIITASFGVGKTSTLRHTALQLAEEGYDVLLVTEPSDIDRFNNPNKKTLFVIDDLCVNFSVDKSDIKSWEPVMEDIKEILDQKHTKILAACQLQVYKDEQFDSLSVFKSCVCNMLSESICLSTTEKHSIARLYLKEKVSEIDDYYNLYDCFPLLCQLYHDSPELNVSDFFQNPFSVYEAEIDKLRKKGYHTKYCALALCIMFNNELNEEILTGEVNEVAKTIIENTCEACQLDRGTSRLVLQNELKSLTTTFIKNERNVYKTIHDKIFDFLVYYFGGKITPCLIKNADISLIKDRFLLERKDDMDQFITIIPIKYHNLYIQRMIDDWSKGKVEGVFDNINMKIPQFRQKLLSYLNTLNVSLQRQLANIFDKPYNKPFYMRVEVEDDTYDTALLHYCYIGDISLIEWCCNNGVDVNRCSHSGQSPIMIGCEQGHKEVVKMLLDRGADCNKCDWRGQSPVMKACKQGHTEVVKMLLDRGADCDKCDWRGQSPVMKACEQGHTEIVKILLDRGADYNKCDEYEKTPVMRACEQNHTEIVKILLDRQADFNKCDENGQPTKIEVYEHGLAEKGKMSLDRVNCDNCFNQEQSTLMKACEDGHIETIKVLIDMGDDCNKCDKKGQSPVMRACEQGHTEIVKMLLDRGADCNECDIFGQSTLMMACTNGRTEILTMLLDKGADYNKCNKNGHSPVMKACEQGHTEIVKMLLDRGADCNKCDSLGQSTVMKACENGRTEILTILLDRGADYNKCNKNGHSPVMKACEQGHTEIVKMLLDRGADCNKCNKKSQSPVMKACEQGHTEIVKMLLDRGVDRDKCDTWGKSPIDMACEHGYTEIVKTLLDRGADYNKCDWDGESLVMKACKHGKKEMVVMLLDRGADCNECDEKDKSPVVIACEHGHTEIVKMLLDRDADCNECYSLEVACKHGHTEIVKILLDRGADCNTYNWLHESVLMKACKHGHTEVVKMLLDRGADCDKCDGFRQSPVMVSCEHGHTEIVKMLLDKGADYTIRDSNGRSPLKVAKKKKYKGIVALIKEKSNMKCN